MNQIKHSVEKFSDFSDHHMIGWHFKEIMISVRVFKNVSLFIMFNVVPICSKSAFWEHFHPLVWNVEWLQPSGLLWSLINDTTRKNKSHLNSELQPHHITPPVRFILIAACRDERYNRVINQQMITASGNDSWSFEMKQMLFLFFHHWKLNIFALLTVDQTKRAIWRCCIRFCKVVLSSFYYFSIFWGGAQTFSFRGPDLWLNGGPQSKSKQLLHC